VLLAGAGLAAAYAYRTATDRPESGLDTDLEGVSVSTATETVALPETTTEASGPTQPERPPERCWTEFGGNARRTLALPDVNLGRPTKALWARGVGGLMEYAPSFCDGTLYVNTQTTGKTMAVDAESGRVLWTRRGGEKASTPAIAGPRLIVSSQEGSVEAFVRATGKSLWKFEVEQAIESSPIAIGTRVYFGTKDGRLFALDVRTGAVRWAFDTGGRINASPSVFGGRVCITTYAGSIFCVRQRDGRQLWGTYVKRDLLRYESFYASPSTDGERIYAVARTGKVVALSARSGDVAWTQHMGALSYATAAVSEGRVFTAAHDGGVRAWRATTGAPLWRRFLDGRVGGSPLVVGDLIFVSTAARRTYALRVTDGVVVWRFNAGDFMAGIATDRRYYFSLGGLLVAFRGRFGPR
jgi:outer membrane protein assembly factor BamB